MIKKHKLTLIISSVIIILPIVVGLILWDKIPDRVATHWNISGEVDGWSSKPFAVFFLPLIVLALHWLCVLGSSFDKKNKGQNKKAMGLVLWICPVVSLFTSGLTYSSAMGIKVNVILLGMCLIGVVFIIIGNYMPKIKQNYTLGIKIPWTLKSEENWNATHRFCGKIWVGGGFLYLIGAFLGKIAAIILLAVVLPVLVIVPCIYSYIYYKKNGTKEDNR